MPDNFGLDGWGGGHYKKLKIKNEKVKIEKFEDIFSLKSLLQSWEEFKAGKTHKADVAEFASRLISNLYSLHYDIMQETYEHGGYTHFKINDQKPRDIHKASVRDRVVHHALCRALYPYFDRKFISDSYSCRIGKGSHRALRRFAAFARRESRNNTLTAWSLNCDIKKCFASIDHPLLKSLLKKHISCPRLLVIMCSVIDSFSINQSGKGIPLGNLTSQLFVNIYLHELDVYAKRILKVRSYIRYADDFTILFSDKDRLMETLPRIGDFLEERLLLELRPNDRPIRTIHSGVDFLGWVHFSDHRVLRAKTKWRMLTRLERSASHAALASYWGLLSHGNAHKLSDIVKERFVLP
ncbi:MAG: group II intron reverse transcriptase domain-containing protein [Candidatus Colwellbacteria bacterium]|nr:group II intron reverse transcriptase domain-containing protein [Candidatus Colwellbacteria bacterium]